MEEQQKNNAASLDAETQAELARLKKRAAVGTVIILGGFLATFFFGFLFKNNVLIPIGFGALVIGAIIAGSTTKKYNAYYKENVVRNMTLSQCDFLDNLEFTPGLGISRDEIRSLSVISSDTFKSNDLITATYKGVSFRQSDVEMTDIHHDKDGTHEVTVFKGRWMVYDFNKDFNWDLQVLSKNFLSAHRIGGIFRVGGKRAEKVELESQEFNKQYRVFAQDQHEAFYLLTPAIMDALLKLKEELRAPLMLVFRNGTLHVAVYNNQDAFEGKIFGKMNLEEEKERIIRDIRLVTDFVDALAMERDIYKY